MTEDRISAKKTQDRIITQKRLKNPTCKLRTTAAESFKSALVKHRKSVNDLLLDDFRGIIQETKRSSGAW